MFPRAARNQLLRYQSMLYDNNVELLTVTTTRTLTNGTPIRSSSTASSWTGLGSVQYVRPRIQKPLADPTSGVFSDPLAAVAYLPFEAAPTKDMLIVDTDGVLGVAGQAYNQSRAPANVGGLDVYWECYLGEAVNADI